jgi:hypothetical protein
MNNFQHFLAAMFLAKTLRAREEQTVQIRIETYNITNTPSFQPPGRESRKHDFGQHFDHGKCYSTANAPRTQVHLFEEPAQNGAAKQFLSPWWCAPHPLRF